MGRFDGVANSYMYLVLSSLFLSDGFLLYHIVMFLDSSGFHFCMDWNLVQWLFTSLWIVLWWWLYVAVLIMGLSDIGFYVFSLGSICVGLMFWIRVVVAFLMFCLLPF